MTSCTKHSCPITTKPEAAPPPGWSWAGLCDVARLESDHTPSRRVPGYWEGGDVPWLSLKDIRGLSGKYVLDTVDHPTPLGIANSSARLLPKGTVALCRTASVGNVAILGKEMSTSQDFVNWVCGPRLLPEYLYWAFRGSEATFDLEKQGSTHQTIYMPVVSRFNVLLPPLPEQRRIAEILDRAEALRAKRRAAIAQMDELTQAIFVDMFGDPATNPKEWPMRKIRDLLESASYGTSEKSAAMGEYPVLRMSNITSTGAMDLGDLKYMDLAPAQRDRYLVRTGDVLFNRTNSAELVGKTAIFRHSKPMAYAGYLIRLRTNPSNDTEYVAAFLNTGYAKKMLRAMCKSIIGMANINATELQSMDIPQPPTSLQQTFARKLVAVEKLKSPHLASATELEALFAALQHRAFRGEL